MNRLFAATAMIVAVMAAPASANVAQTLCKIEVDASEIKQPSRRPDAVAFIKRAEGQVAVFRRGGEAVEEIPATIGMEI